MVDAKTKVIFEPVELKAEPSWYVRVAFSSGQQTYLGGFISQAAAQEWIALKSVEWLALKECEQKAPPCLTEPPR
jgi:hypothetical protein